MAAGDDILAYAESHYQEIIGATEAVEIPEWGPPGQPAILYHRPPTPEEYDEILKALKDGEMSGLIQAIVTLARDSEGKRLFTKAHRTQLRRKVSGDVVNRLGNELLKNIAKPEDAEGN